MKFRIAIIILLIPLLTGCSGDEKDVENTNVIVSEASKEINNESINEDLNNKKNRDNKVMENKGDHESSTKSTEDDWFVGAINDNLKIHMKLDMKGNKISGKYYYDKYKKDIIISGYRDGNIFSVGTKDSKETIEGMFISDNLIEGIWTDGDVTYPIYLMNDKDSSLIPKKPNNTLMEWKGNWQGGNSGYYRGSRLIIEPIFNNLIKFDLSAFNGTRLGGLSSFAVVENNIATFIGEEGIKYIFTLNNEGNIKLNSDDYSYYCGAGVSFDSIYTKKDFTIAPPTAKEVGLVYSKEQENIFKNLTGEYYRNFIEVAQFFSEEEDLDGIGANVRTFGLLSYPDAAIVMINQQENLIKAAVHGLDGIYYFSNSEDYGEPPETIKEWAKGQEIIICENKYKQNKSNISINPPKKYIDFMKKRDKSNDIALYAKEDINGDGDYEVILASGINSDKEELGYIEHIYILKEDSQGNLKQLGDNLARSGYSIYQVRLIELNNSSKKYIYCGLTNGVSLRGFSIFELSEDKPKMIAYSASATGSGFDELKDFNGDGKFDGYVQNRSSYDVLYYEIKNTYILKNDEFVLDKTWVDVPEYPENIKDIIIQYMSLRVLNNGKSPEIDKRLSQMCTYDKAEDIDIPESSTYTVLYNTIMGNDKGIEINIEEEDNIAKTVATFSDNDIKYKYIFRLIKIENRWVIDDIKNLSENL